MRFAFLLAAAAFVVAPAMSQPLLSENFDYAVGDTLTAPPLPWIHHSGSGDSLLVTDNNLTFTGYPLSTGNSTFVEHGSGSREDAHLGFAPDSLSSVYSALLVNASTVTTDADGGYFFHLTQEPHSTFIFRGRVYLRAVLPPAGEATFHEFNFGISKASGNVDIVWDSVVRLVDTTYLLVMKYDFLPGDSTDTVDLYIFEDGDDISVEPGSPDVSSIDVNSDLLNAGTINLRQGGDTMGLTVDGIKVATSWANIIGVSNLTVSCTPVAPPIVINSTGGFYQFDLEIINTSASAQNFQIWLNVDGPGVGIERGPVFKSLAPGDTLFRALAQSVPGPAPSGDYTQTCSVGSVGSYPIADDSDVFAWTKSAVFAPGGVSVADWGTEAEFAAALAEPTTTEGPTESGLEANYPNPFNPSTTIHFDLPESAQVRLVVFDVLGRQISVLVDGTLEAGTHEVVFDASELPSGTYLYRLETPQGSFVRTMLLAK